MFKVELKLKDSLLNLELENKVTLKDLAKSYNVEAYCAKVNNRIRELNYYINYNCTLEFLDLNDFASVRVYETSLRYLIVMALERLYDKPKIEFDQSISRSIMCQVSNISDVCDSNFLRKLKSKIDELIDLDLPITRKTISINEANEIYSNKGYSQKVEILKYRPEDSVNIYECDGYVNYLFGYMVPSTGYLKNYRLKLYYPGFLIQYPRAEKGGKIFEFEDNPSFGRMISESKKWAKMIDCDMISKLNNHASNGNVSDLVNICEMKHNNMLADLGQQIKNNIDNIRLICIAGPSSSGKTTFSHRLRIELMTRGIKPVKISMDDYYLDRDKCPLDEEGKYDLEHVDALDVELFNRHLLSLIQGEEVEIPSFDFKTGKRVKGHKVRISNNSPIIIEGIHALNEKLTSLIPKHQKFKIYISPISEIKIDTQNPINASELRLLRRCVRDSKYRKTVPNETLSMWPSVRRGEFKWIYPCQEQADYVFNSELTYELGVMKKYALPALSQIDRNDENFITANRLVKFLKYVKDIDDRYVPCNSLLREFIGESCFYEFK